MLTEHKNSRVVYAWENPGVPVDQVVNDVLRAFHHPALRDESIQIQRDMFATVRNWAQETRHPIDQLLSSDSVRHGRNHILNEAKKSDGSGHSHGTFGAFQDAVAGLGHGKVKGSLWSQIQNRDLSAMGGGDGFAQAGYMSASPAPRPASSSGGFGYQGGGDGGGGGGGTATHEPPQGAAYGQAASYYSGATASPQPPPVPEPGYGGAAAYAYGQQPPHYGGQWGQGPPPPGYGPGPGYGQGPPPPPFSPYGGPPPPGWGQNPGGYPGRGHRW